MTYTITVTPTPPGNGVPTGSVVLYDGANVLSTLTLISGGTASYITALPVGGQILSAAYGGDLNFQPSTSAAVNEIVNKIQSTLNLTSSVPAGAVASQVITFTAQIQPNPPVGVAVSHGPDRVLHGWRHAARRSVAGIRGGHVEHHAAGRQPPDPRLLHRRQQLDSVRSRSILSADGRHGDYYHPDRVVG